MTQSASVQCCGQRWEELEKIGSEVLHTYLGIFNTGNALAWAKSLHYPHIRLAGGKVQVWNTPEDYARDNDVTPMKEGVNWGWTQWNWVKMIQADETKMHFTVGVTRYTPDCQKIVTFESFYVLTKINDRWGIQFRSSYAGIFAENSAY